jgi:putative methyltransferase (TIGR04325 family)
MHMSDDAFATNSSQHLFRGVFDSFEAARASAPPTRPIGYDNAASAELYLKRLRVDDHDYPALVWLAKSFGEGMTRLADCGGAIGIKYFAFGKFIDFPASLDWLVVDVPAVAERGRLFAASRGAPPALRFTADFADADGMEIFFASGSLQYLDRSLPEILGGFDSLPKRIIINTTPIHPVDSFFTLNSIGTAFCPYRITAHAPFIDGIEDLGYRMRDEWRNLGKHMEIPGEPSRSLNHYSGFCFDLRAGRP